MMHGRGKSDSAIVAERPTNKAGRPAEELEERRAETEGNAVQQSITDSDRSAASMMRWTPWLSESRPGR